MTKGRKKKPAAVFLGPSPKIPRVDPNFIPNVGKLSPVWRFSRLDRDGHKHCKTWDGMTAEQAWKVYNRLASLESRTWAEIDLDGSHFIEISRLPPAAQGRAREIKLDVDQLYSLRIQGRIRIWGIRDGHVLKILWWDPHHQTYPVAKKYT